MLVLTLGVDGRLIERRDMTKNCAHAIKSGLIKNCNFEYRHVSKDLETIANDYYLMLFINRE